jgi:Na+/melibiose symporter-like transporter
VDRTRAAGIGQATTATAAIVGPPLAAPLLFTVGLQWALLVNVASYVVSYVAISSVRTSPAAPAQPDAAAPASSIRREFVDGLRFFGRNRFLVALLSIAVIAQFGTGALNALDVFFVTQNLHASSRLYGLMSMAFGVGAILGSLWAGRVVRWFGARTATWLGLTVTGILVFSYARQTVFVAGLVLLTLVSIPVAMLNTAMTPLLLDVTPPEYLGRMVAVFNPINQMASMLSVVVAGWLASTLLSGFGADLGGLHFGPIDTIFAASGVLIVLAGVYAHSALPHPSEQPAPAVPNG